MKRVVIVLGVLLLVFSISLPVLAQEGGGTGSTAGGDDGAIDRSTIFEDGTQVVYFTGGAVRARYPSGNVIHRRADGSWWRQFPNGMRMVVDQDGNLTIEFRLLKPYTVPFITPVWSIELGNFYLLKLIATASGSPLAGMFGGIDGNVLSLFHGGGLMSPQLSPLNDMITGSMPFGGALPDDTSTDDGTDPATTDLTGDEALGLSNLLGAANTSSDCPADAGDTYRQALEDLEKALDTIDHAALNFPRNAIAASRVALDGGAHPLDTLVDVHGALDAIRQYSVGYGVNAPSPLTGDQQATLTGRMDAVLSAISALPNRDGTCTGVILDMSLPPLDQRGDDLLGAAFDDVGSDAMPAPLTYSGPGFLEDFGVHPTQPKIALGDENGTITIWNAETGGAQTLTMSGTVTRGIVLAAARRAGPVTSVAFSPDGTRLAAVDEQTVVLWDAATLQEVARLAVGGSKWNMAFSPDGSLLAYASGNDIHLIDVATFTELPPLTGHTNTAWGLAFSPDGTRLASGAWDSTLIIWDLATGEPQHVLPADSGGQLVEHVAFSVDGSLVASTAYDGSVRVWDVTSGTQLRVLEGMGGKRAQVMFSPRGDMLITLSPDGVLRGWAVVSSDAAAVDAAPVSDPASGESGGETTGCTVSAAGTVNLRSGPGTTYDVAGTLAAGQIADVDGQATGADGFVWWHLALEAWVRSDVVNDSGDCAVVLTLSP